MRGPHNILRLVRTGATLERTGAMRLFLDAMEAPPLVRGTMRFLAWPFQWTGSRGAPNSAPRADGSPLKGVSVMPIASSLLARKAARADHDGDAALRRRLGGHATFDRWRAALALHAKTGDWEPARAILDEFWELGRELAPVAAALRKMPGAKADAVADAVRLLGHSDDEVRLETIRAVAGWGEDARPLLGTIRGRAGAAEPDADVRHAARALIASFD